MKRQSKDGTILSPRLDAQKERCPATKFFRSPRGPLRHPFLPPPANSRCTRGIEQKLPVTPAAPLRTTMDTYAKSVQDVDAALNRLNATLAAYRSAKSPVKSQSQRPGTQTAPVPNGARQESPAKHPLPIREQAAPVAQGRWKDVLDLRASQSLSEVCSKPGPRWCSAE